MRQNKIRLLLALTAAALSLAGCQKGEEPEDVSEVPAEVQESEEAGGAAKTEASEAEAPVSAEKPMAPKEIGKVSVEREEGSGQSAEDDKEHSYTYTYQKAVITIPGNEEAEAKIQASIDAELEKFLSYVNGGEFGAVFEGSPAEPSSDAFAVTVMRADEKVVSLQFSDEGYDGGAHGWFNVHYRNYFTSTGEEITFADLGEGFRAKAEELVREKAAAMQEKEQMFFEDYEKSIPLVVADGTEDRNEIYKEIYDWWTEEDNLEDSGMKPAYYITESGFTFVSGQYVLQPYAGGIVDFEIPYEDFGDAYTGDIF